MAIMNVYNKAGKAKTRQQNPGYWDPIIVPPKEKPPQPTQTGVAPLPQEPVGYGTTVENVAPLPSTTNQPRQPVQVDRTGSPDSYNPGPQEFGGKKQTSVDLPGGGKFEFPTPKPPGLPGGPIPSDPLSAFDPKTRQILEMYPEFKSARDLESLNSLRTQGWSTGRDRWTDALMNRQRMDETRLGDLARGQTASALAGAESNLAMRGGLSGGARERMASTGAVTTANALQDVARSGMEKRADLDVEGERRKDDLRKLVTGYDVGDVGAENLYGINKGNTFMQALANQQLADAIRGNQGSPQNQGTVTGVPDPIGDEVPWLKNYYTPAGSNLAVDANTAIYHGADDATGGSVSDAWNQYTEFNRNLAKGKPSLPKYKR